jgi:hypothetical protein
MEAAMEMSQHENAVGPPQFVPSEEWIEAFEAQATHELRKAAKRFARMRARFVAIAGGRVDDYYVSSLVQDVLTDTLFGVLTWDPGVSALENHVFDAIKSRTSHDITRAKKLRHQSIDAFDSRYDTSAVMTDLETSLELDWQQPRPEALRFSAEVIEQLRSLAPDDKGVSRMLDAIEQGAVEAKDIMHLAGMSKKTYHKARARLGRIAEQLSNRVLIDARTRA